MKVKTKFTKRILSFALALCMLAALVPAMPAAEAAGEEASTPSRSLVYDFRKGFSQDVETITYDNTTSDDDDSDTDTELNTSIFSDPWASHLFDQGFSKRQQSYITGALSSANMGIYLNAPYGDYGCIVKFQVTEAGNYIPAVTISGNWTGSYTSGLDMTFAIGKVKDAYNIENVIASTGSVNAGGINAPMTVYLSETPVYFNAGEYALRITGTDEHADIYNGMTSYMAFVRDLKLMTSEDYQEKLEIDETAKANELVYDFAALNNENYDTQSEVDSITYADTLGEDGAAWTVYGYYKNYPLDTTLWTYDTEPGFGYRETGRGLYVKGEKREGGAAIMLHVPASGKYTAKLTASNPTGSSATLTNVYIMPLKANRSVGTATTTAIQDRAISAAVQGASATASTYVFNGGEEFELEAGEYVLHAYLIDSNEFIADKLVLTLDTAELATDKVAVKNGASATTSIAAVNNSTTVDMTDGSITSVTVADTSVATATAAVSGDKIAVSVTGGTKTGFTTAEIWATATDGTVVCDTVGIFVNPLARVGGEHVIWDFRKGENGVDASGTYVPTITYDKTTLGSAAELNPSVYSEPWNASGVSSGTTYYLGYAKNIGMRLTNANATYSFNLKLDQGGSFVPCITFSSIGYSGVFSGTSVDVSLTKSGESTAICSVANVNTGSVEGPVNVYLSNEAIDFAAGEYVLTIKGNGWHSEAVTTTSTAWLQKFRMMTSVPEKLAKNDEGAVEQDLYYNFAALNTAERLDSQEAAERITYSDAVNAGSDPWYVYDSVYGGAASASVDFFDGHEKALYYKTAGKGIYSNAGELIDKISRAGQGAGSIAFHVPKDGKYTLTLDAECVGGTTQAYIYKLNDNGSIGARLSDISINTTATNWSFNNGVPMELASGEYILHVYNGRSCNGVYLNGLRLTTTADDAEIPPSDIFGSKYAYVKQVGDSYTLSFVGGLQEISGYSEVGFEVTVNGDEKDNIKTTEVYENVVVGNQTYGASYYGGEYIFIAKQTGLKAGDIVEITPYVIKGSGDEAETIYHDNLTLSLKIR